MLSGFKDNDFSYQNRKNELHMNSPGFNEILHNLIIRWMRCEQIICGRDFLSEELKGNTYLSYIKKLFSNQEIIKEHYLLASKHFDSDCFSCYIPLKKIDKFFVDFNDPNIIPLDMPADRYFGKHWLVDECNYMVGKEYNSSHTSENEEIFPPFSHNGKECLILELEEPFKFIGMIDVRDLNSPFPGVIMNNPFRIDNLKDLINGGSKLVLRLPFRVKAEDIDNFHRDHNIPIPDGSDRSICLWLDRVLFLSLKQLINQGIKLCG